MGRQSDCLLQVDWNVLECGSLASATPRVTKYRHAYTKGIDFVAIALWNFVAAAPMRTKTEH
jgi:hypothetical protein